MRAEGDGGLERFCSPGKGRGLRALQPFQVGDLLFSCPAYAYVLTVNERGNHCEFCFARKEGLSKCGRCKQAFYCNVECQGVPVPSCSQGWKPSLWRRMRLDPLSAGLEPTGNQGRAVSFRGHLWDQK